MTATEAAQVFEIVRTRIISGSSFMEKPDGIDGITVLAKVHPTLQDKILDLLEGLPEDQLGAWAVSGWREVFKESKSVDRFERLLQQWANAPKNSILKVTAMSVLKTTKGGQ